MTETKAQTIRQIVPLGPDVIYAPPAFKGQKSGGTKARFQMIEDRLKAAQESK